MARTAERHPGDVVTAVSAAVDEALTAQWWRGSDDDVRSAVVELERQANRLEAARLRLLAEADARDVGAPSGAACTADWFAHSTNSRPERTGARVALAAALNGELAATGAALATGDITGEHAAVIHRAVGKLAPEVDVETRKEAQAFLLEHAPGLDPRRLARVARRLRHRLDPESGDQVATEEDAQIRRRELAMTQDDEGTWWLSGSLDPVAGQSVRDALDPHAVPLPAAPDGTPDRRSARRRLADALVHVCERALAGDTSATGVSRPRVILTTTLPALTAAPGAPGVDGGTLACGQPISVDTVRMLTCDGEIVPVLIDGVGRPLDVGRTVYAFPTRIRTAILARDDGCTFNSCTRPAGWCQVHHVTAYSAGGPTSERNGVSLCEYHHRLVHRQGWRAELDGSLVIWHPPERDGPLVPPPPWAPALDRLVRRWLDRNQHLIPVPPHASEISPR